MSEEETVECEGEECLQPQSVKCQGEYCKNGLETFGQYISDTFTVLTFFIVWMMQFWFAIGTLSVELFKFLSTSSGAVRRVFVGSGLILLLALIVHSLGGRTATAMAKNKEQNAPVERQKHVSVAANCSKSDKSSRSSKPVKSAKCCKENIQPPSCSKLSTLLDLFFTGQVFWA